MREAVRRAQQVCPVEVAVVILGGAWKLSIAKALLERGTLRTAQLRRGLPGISERTLTRQLRELESDGVVDRVVLPEVPPHVKYSLTTRGRSLAPVIAAMDSWGAQVEAELDDGA